MTTSVSMSGTHFSTLYLICTVNILLLSLRFYFSGNEVFVHVCSQARFVAAIAKKRKKTLFLIFQVHIYALILMNVNVVNTLSF